MMSLSPYNKTETFNSLVHKTLIVLISLCSFSFFLIRGIGKGDRIIELTGIGLIVFFLFFQSIYSDQHPVIRKHFSWMIFLFLASALLSVFSAQFFHDQSVWITLYQQRHLYYYLFYFLIPFIFPDSAWIKNFIFYVAIAGALIYIVQYFFYPVKITEAKMFIDRGTLRINLPGSSFRHLGYFLCVDSFFRTFKKKYAYGAFLLLIVAVLSAYRSTVAVYVITTLVYVMVNRRVKYKLLILVSAAVIGTLGYFAFQPILDKMSSSAQRESSQGDDYVRIKSGQYFLNEMGKNPVITVLGNGEPSEQSFYGKEIISIPLLYGFYLSDIGILGSYYKYGLLFMVSAVLIILRLTFLRLNSDLNFVKLYMIMQLLLLFTMYPAFEDASGIVALVLVLSLVDRNLTPSRLKEKIDQRARKLNMSEK